MTEHFSIRSPFLHRITATCLLLVSSAALYALEIDPLTRQHRANDPSDWSGGITVRPAANETNWQATVVPDEPVGDATWLSITPVPPNFLVYAMVENFNAEDRKAYIEFTGGLRFEVVQSGRGATLSMNAFTFGKDGGTNQFAVTVLPGTFWNVTSTTSWIRVLSGPTGFGSDTIRFAVDPYGGVLPREGTFVVGGNVVRVSQSGIDLTIEPKQTVVGDKLSIVTFNVNALASQAWKPTSLSNWITVLNPGPGTGNGIVTSSALPNQNYQPRQGTVAVGSKEFVINQAGNQNPTLSITPAGAVGSDEGAQGRFHVIVTPGTPWHATSNVPWLQIVAGADGIGSDTIAFVISPNRTLIPRDATITVSAADPLPAPDLRRGLAQHLVFDGASAGDNLILAQGSNEGLTDFPRATGRNGGRALRFDGGKSWTFGLSGQETTSFWLSSDFSNRQSVAADIGGHILGISATERFTLDGQVVGSAVATGAWYHLLIRRIDQNVDLFLDGKLLQTIQEADALVTINPTSSFIGKLDDFRRYVRPLDSFEVESLFRDESSGQGLAIYQPSPSTSQSVLPLIGRIQDDVNTIDLVSGRQWVLPGTSIGTFTIVPGSFTWSEAYEDAIKRGGILAWWSTGNELDQVLAIVGGFGGNVWINALDEGHEGVWKYRAPISARPFPGTIPWVPGQPDNLGGTQNFALFATGANATKAIDEKGSGIDQLRSYLMRELSGEDRLTLDSIDRSVSGGTAIACRFKSIGSLGFSDSIILEAADSIVRLATDDGASYFDWPLPEPLGDRQHVVALVLTNAASLTVYLDGEPLFSRPTSVSTPGSFKALMTENGDVRAYGRPLSAQETAGVSAELAPRIQYFTLSQAAAVPSLTKQSETVPAAGGTVQTELIVPTGVPWSATSSDSWLSFVAGNNTRTNALAATGQQVISVFTDENNTTDSRLGSVTIAGLPFAVSQSGRTVTLNPLSNGTSRYGENVNAIVRETGGAVLVGIFPEAGSAWTLRYAEPQDESWIVPTPASGVGSKDVLFAVSPYNSPLASRTAVFSVADKEIRVTQRGYTATVTPFTTNFPGVGGDGQVQVTVPGSVFWEAVALSPWITIVTDQNANGGGTVLFKVSSNTGPARFGTIVIAGEVIQLAQAASVESHRPRLELVGSRLSVFGEVGITHIVERSFDLRNWDVVAQVVANGDSQAVELTIQISGQRAQFFRARIQGTSQASNGL